MNTKFLRQIIREAVSAELREAEEEKNDADKRKKGARQVKAFLDSLERSSLARKLKSIDTHKEKLEILVKFAEMIDFPKDKITKLSSDLRSK
jgi:hypothetical protein